MICVSLFYYKEGTNIKGLVLNRVSILGIFCPKMGQGFKPSATYLYPNIGRVPPPRGVQPPLPQEKSSLAAQL